MELYRRGAVSRGKAAELLGMPLVEFLQLANELGIPYFDYTDEEFAAELAASKRWQLVESPYSTRVRSLR